MAAQRPRQSLERQYYQSILPVPTDSRVPYNPNIDIVTGAIYGAVPVTDTKLLATAALLRSQWADPNSPNYYPINGADQQRGIGPLLGRYPGDTYDGDTNDPAARDHPWAIATANFAELYYQLASQVTSTGTVPLDSLSAAFFNQIGVNASTTPKDATAGLETHGDQMLQALVYHSAHFESASSSTPAPASRRASETSPGATPHSCRRSAPRALFECAARTCGRQTVRLMAAYLADCPRL